MDNMISLHLKMALLHKPTALRVISLEWMDLYSAKKKTKQTTGTNQILHEISAQKNARLILCFRVGTGKKHLYCVVWFISAELYGFGKEG